MGEHMDKSKGKVKQTTDRMTDNDEREREGKRDKVKGRAEGSMDDAKEKKPNRQTGR